MEKVIKITAGLYRCRDTAKRFFREEFQEKIKPYKEIITAVMKAHNIDEFEAITKISETEHYQDDGMVQLLYLTAMVELIEPSES